MDKLKINASDFLQKCQQFQYDIMFNQIIDLGFARIGYCKNDKSTFWNSALTDQLLSSSQLNQIQEKMELLNRQPAIYFHHREELEPLIKNLLENGFKKDFEDSWMFYQNPEINTDGFSQIKKVENKNDLKVYLDTFDACYQLDDPQNPYGQIGDYLKVTEEVWHRHHKNNRLEYFIAFKGDKPVAVATLDNYKGIGYISNVGSLKEVRGEGFGKLVTLYCVHKSQENGNKIHCLATEEGTYPNEVYKRIGFKTLFTAICYALK